MSKVIDERVVEMRFDNKDFESNVQTSLKTIDKLKDSLNFDESTRSIDRFQDSLRHFSLDDIGQSVDRLSDKFNWGNVFKMELLHNVCDSIYSTITGVFDRIKGELHLEDVDPVSNMIQGWGKYAEKTESVATIMAATGESIEYVNEQMEKLLFFSDETSYSFTDMSSNIGKFTANGVELETAASAMEGIATWAARSGQNASTASRVMYNLSQAIGMGALKLQDWKSVELANMGTKEFKEMAIQAGLLTGTLEKNAAGLVVLADGTADTTKETLVTIENFRETLKDGWLDTETLLSTLGEYGKAAELIGDINKETGLYAAKIVELAEAERDGTLTIKELAEALDIQDEEIDNNRDALEDIRQALALLGSEEYSFSLETYKAAQEARTFGQAMESVADAVSSKWMKTFELLFGGYEKAKGLWSDLAENLYEIFAEPLNERNKLLEEANKSGFDNFAGSLANAGVSLQDIEKTVSRIIGTGNLREIVDTAGSFENAIKKGYISVETLKQAIDEIPGSFKIVKEVTEGITDNYEEMTEWSWELRQGLYGWDEGHDYQVKKLMEAKGITEEYAEQVVRLSEKHYELGRALTKEEAAEFLTLTELSKLVEENIEVTDEDREAWKELAEQVTKASAQESFVDGLMNIGHLAVEVFTQAREAVKGLFPPATADRLKELASGFERTTKSILNFVEKSEVVKNVVTALVFPFRVIYDVIGAAFSLIAPFGKIILSVFTPIIGVISSFGAWLTSIRKTTNELNPLSKVIDKVADALKTLLSFIAQVAAYVGNIVKNKLVEKLSGPFQKLVELFNKFKENRLGALDSFIETLKKADAEKVGDYILSFLKELYRIAGIVGNALKVLFSPFTTFIKYLGILNKNAKDLSTFQRVLLAFEGTARTVLAKIQNKFKEFGIDISPVTTAISNFISNMSDKLNKIKTTVSVFVSDFLRRFKELGIIDKDMNIFDRLFVALSGTLTYFNPKLEEVINKLREFRQIIKNFFKGTEEDTEKGFFESLSDRFAKTKQDIKDFFSNFKLETEDGKSVLQSFVDSLGITLPKALTGIGVALAGSGLIKLIKTLKETKDKKGGNLIGNVIDALNPFSDTLESLKTATSSFNIVSFAIGVGLLAGALIALSYVPADKLDKSLGTIGASLAGFIGTIAAVNKVMGDKGTFRLVGMGLGMVAISASLLLFAKAMNAFKQIDISSNSDIQKILGGLLLAAITLSTIAKAAGKSNFKLSGGLGLVATAAALFLFAKSLEKFANLKISGSQIPSVLGGLLAAIITFSVIAKAIGKSNFKLTNGLGLVAMATSLYMFAGLIAIFGHMKLGTLVKGGIVLGVLGLLIAKLLELTNKATKDMSFGRSLGTFVFLTGIVAAVAAFGVAAVVLGFIPIGVLLKGIVAVGALGLLVTKIVELLNKAMSGVGLRQAASTILILVGVVVAIGSLAVVLTAMGVLWKTVLKGCGVLAVILLEIWGVFALLKHYFADGASIKNALIGIAAIWLFGKALKPMITALQELEKVDFKTTQKNMILLGELFAAFLVLVGVAALVGAAASVAGPILLVGIGVVAGVFALFIYALTKLVENIERLANVDSTKAKEGLECVKAELEILTDLAHQFMAEEGLFEASLQAAKVCRKFGKGLHELAEDTFILGLANATQAKESLKVVQEEIDLMFELGQRLIQNEGAFSQAILASATAFSFGVGLHGLANDTKILGLVNAENAKAAIEPLSDLIVMMIGLAETMGTDPMLFGKAIVTAADMVAFATGLLPLVGVEFVAGLADAANVTANMTQISTMIDKLFDLATQIGDDSSLYFGAKATAIVIKDFGNALIPLVSAEFMSQFVDAEASTAGFKATEEIVDWLIGIAGHFQGENSINTGAGAAVDRLNGFAKSLAKLTVADFFSQFVDADRALEGLKPVQAVVDMLVSMVNDLTLTETSTEAAKVAVESVKTFGESLNDMMWTLSSGSWETIDPTNITNVVNAIVEGLRELTSIEGDIAGIGASLEGIGDIFASLNSLGTTGGIFTKKSIDTSSITKAFKAIGEAIVELGTTITTQSIGTKIIESIITPLTNETATASDAVLALGQSISNTIASFEELFFVDGNNLAVGFVNGIYSRVQDAYDAGYQLASDAERGTRDAGEISSPSKVFTELGGYIGEGFIEGIESKYGQISQAAQGMAQRAIEIVSELRERLQALLADKANELHITPVVDMTDISHLSDVMTNMKSSRMVGANYVNSAEIDNTINSKGYTAEMQTLIDYVSQLGEHIDNMQMVLDTGVLVGATSAKMDSQFGIMTMRRGRGN